MVSDELLDATTVAAIGCTMLYMVLFFTTFFKNKFNRQSTFIISLLIYLSFASIALSVWLAERWGYIGTEETDVVRLFTRAIVLVGAALGVKYLLTPPNEYHNKSRMTWAYLIGGILIFSSLFYFFPVEITHAK